jgi:hypothetical protein
MAPSSSIDLDSAAFWREFRAFVDGCPFVDVRAFAEGIGVDPDRVAGQVMTYWHWHSTEQ